MQVKQALASQSPLGIQCAVLCLYGAYVYVYCLYIYIYTHTYIHMYLFICLSIFHLFTHFVLCYAMKKYRIFLLYFTMAYDIIL